MAILRYKYFGFINKEINMSINSMTGFASLKGELDSGSFTINVKSVNNRFLDMNCRLPDFLLAREFDINQIIKSLFSRGKFDLTIEFYSKNQTKPSNINRELARSFADAAMDIKNYLTESDEPVSTSINPCDILLMPGVISETEQINYDDVAAQIIEKFPEALNMLKATRAFEGNKLKEFLEANLASISAEIDKIRVAMPDIVAWQKQKLTELIENANLKLNNELLEQELIIFSQRIDIAEEINRLTAHVAQARNILTQGGTCGKKLDFLMQEFNRESNTIASKSITTNITNAAIELKVLIEQMREQVQNIE